NSHKEIYKAAAADQSRANVEGVIALLTPGAYAYTHKSRALSVCWAVAALYGAARPFFSTSAIFGGPATSPSAGICHLFRALPCVLPNAPGCRYLSVNR